MDKGFGEEAQPCTGEEVVQPAQGALQQASKVNNVVEVDAMPSLRRQLGFVVEAQPCMGEEVVQSEQAALVQAVQLLAVLQAQEVAEPSESAKLLQALDRFIADLKMRQEVDKVA